MFSYFLISFFLLNFSFSQNKWDGVAAVVGENIILHSDVLQQAQFLAMEQKIDPLKSPYLFEEIFISTLDNIIDQYVVLDIAKKDTTLIISNDEVDRALDQQIESFISRAGSEKLFLEMVGMSMRQIKLDYWKDIRNMMVIERYQFSKIHSIDVGRDEVEHFFVSNKTSLPVVEEQYDFSVIELPFVSGDVSQKRTVMFLDSLKNNIENQGLSFDSLAQIYSHDLGSSLSGGYLGYTSRGSLVKEYEEASYSLSPGDISDPIKTSFGYHLIRLIDRQGEKISTQHILRETGFSENDKKDVFSSIVDLSSLIDNSVFLFDSVASVYSKKYKNFSGVFSDVSLSNIPNNILLELSKLTFPIVSLPVETRDGYAIIYFYNYNKGGHPNLDNSWNLIYEYAKQDKQNKFFINFIKTVKNKTYIKIL